MTRERDSQDFYNATPLQKLQRLRIFLRHKNILVAACNSLALLALTIAELIETERETVDESSRRAEPNEADPQDRENDEWEGRLNGRRPR